MSTDQTGPGYEAFPGFEAGRLAPSAHNSQPWKFRPRGESVDIGWEPGRELPAGDPDSVYLAIELGACAESILIGAAQAGHTAEIAIAGSPAPESAATAHFARSRANASDIELAGALSLRQTTRLPYSPDDVPTGALDSMVMEAERSGCHLGFLTEPRQVKRMAELVGEATKLNIERSDVYEEFFGWVRLSESHPGYHRDGLNLETLSANWLFRRLAPFVMPPGRMAMAKRIGLHRMIAGSQRSLADASPAFGLLIAPGAGFADHFTGGRVMQRVWLRATMLGLKLHPMTATFDNPDTRSDVASLFGIPSDAPMVVCFRLGYGPDAPRSARLPESELIVPAQAT